MKLFLAILAFSVPSLFAQQTPITPRAQAPAAGTIRDPNAPAAAPATDPKKVVMTVGDQKITAEEYEQLIAALPTQYQAAARGAGKRSFAERIVELKILSEEASKRKIDQEPKVKEEISFQRDNLLAQAMFENLQNNVKIDDEAVQKYYDEHKNEFEVLKAHHILIRVKGAPMQAPPGKPELTDEEAMAKAQAIRKRLLAGEDFATVARAESDDTGSGAQGGDLGQFGKGMMVPPFEQAAFAAKVGEVTEPVKSPFGYHLIKVDAHYTKTLAEVRPDIEKKLRPAMAQKAVSELRKNTTVDLDDSFFGPAAPPALVGPAGPSPAPGAAVSGAPK